MTEADTETWLETRRGTLPASPQSVARTAEPFGETTKPRSYGLGVELREKISDGGMSRVIRAQQLSLRRDVVVKTSDIDAECDRLLSEAYVTGALEHPNIVPIHDLLINADGRPQLVLKHIEGRSWHEIIESGETISEFDDDPIEHALRIGVAVSQALSYAHERGIVHRDVKPANVMLGQFGQVYLVDWGLGATYVDDARALGLPRVPTKEIAGTPAYMAPEQYEGLREGIGPWTDVFLLAGTLVHAITGQPPWRRNDSGERVRAPLPEHTPPALVSLLDRALALEPSKRLQSAAEFRYALESYRRQQGSRSLSNQAQQTAERATEAHDAGDLDLVERAATEAEVLFRAALSEWPDNRRAKEQRSAFLKWRVEQALAQGEGPVASRIVATWPDAPAELKQRIENETERALRESIQVDKMKTDLDPSVGVTTRLQLLYVLGPLWVGSWATLAYFESVMLALVSSVAVFILTLSVVLSLRKTLFGNQLNSVTVGTLLSALAGTCIVFAVDHLQQGALSDAATLIMLVYAMSAVFFGLSVNSSAYAIAGLWTLLMITSLLLPQHGLWIIVGGATASTIAALVANWRLVESKATTNACVDAQR